MNINTDHKTSTNKELSQNSFGTLELADADLAIVSGACSACGADPFTIIGAELGLGFGVGCQGAYDPDFFNSARYRFGFGGFQGLPIPCQSGCNDPCR